MESFNRFLVELRKFAPPVVLVVVGAALIGGALTALLNVPSNRVTYGITIACVMTGAITIVVGLFSFARDAGLADYGMVGIWRPKNSGEFRERLSGARSLTVLKTWFPEDEDIQGGLEDALRNNHAHVKLILCRPESTILGIRSESANVPVKRASDWIVKGLKIVSNYAAPDSFEGIGFYDVWPGCPVIWADDRIYMGFYFNGDSSPNFPWIEVKPDSELGVRLKKQKEILWEASEKLETVGALNDWLKENGA